MRSVELPGRVIVLNGTSGSGKTTLARSIQDESDPIRLLGHRLFHLVPPNWAVDAMARSAVTDSGTTAPAATSMTTRWW
ncbi:hypothetical protein [Nocardia sp. NPDC057440]|uniref:phosphotransferase-like protein n=1 Tax=Nocardia sp. NPDC057440 TaxID=3346134 RepID=UPI00366E823B